MREEASSGGWIGPFAGLLLLTALGLAVAAANGAALVQNDTVSYVRAAQFVAGHLGNLLDPPAAPLFGADTRWLPAPERSVYYGALAWLGFETGGFWATMAVQSAILATLAHRLLVRALGLSFPAFAAALVATYLASAAGFYVGSIMPDVFGGFVVLAAVLLVLYPERLSRLDRAMVSLVALFGVLAHTANLLLFVSLGLALVIVRLATRRDAGGSARGRRSGPAALALLVVGITVVGLAGDRVYQGAIARMSGVAPVRAPFLTARLVGDGPGLDYLNSTCGGAGEAPYLLCRFRDRLPLSDDEFLWTTDPARGVYMTVDHATQAALSAEQTRFALGTVLFAPVREAVAAGKNAGSLFARFGLGAFDIGRTRDSVGAFFREGLPSYDAARIGGPVVTNSGLLRALGFLYLAAYGLALVLLALVWLAPALCLRAGLSGRVLDAARGLAPAVILAMVLNAAICGALSGPYSRYQGRVSWVPVLVACGLLAGSALRGRRA